MDSKLEDFVQRLKKIAHYDPEANLPKELVTRSDQAHWIGADITHNPGRIGVMLDIPAKTLELARQEIPPQGTSDLQRHTHESVHFVIEGSGESEIGGATVSWGPGDFIYTPVWVWHRHYNTGAGAVRMLLVENSRLLEPLGLARRESAGLIRYAELSARGGKHGHAG